MKWMKLFEGFDKGEYYYQMDYDEWREKITTYDYVDYTDQEISKVNDIFKKFQPEITVSDPYIMNIQYRDEKGDYKIFDITKTDDDYFIAQYCPNAHPHYKWRYKRYLCDQFDGLLMFLNDVISGSYR